MESPRKILFVCVGNTCRSQMAEGFAKAIAGGKVEVRSAGTSAMGIVNRATADAMREKDIDISDQKSEQLSPEMFEWADVVVSMGGVPAEELCPGDYDGEKLDWPVGDPIGRPIDVMRKVRDDIEEKVRGLVGE